MNSDYERLLRILGMEGSPPPPEQEHRVPLQQWGGEQGDYARAHGGQAPGQVAGESEIEALANKRWSENFLGRYGRGPTQEEWVEHWQRYSSGQDPTWNQYLDAARSDLNPRPEQPVAPSQSGNAQNYGYDYEPGTAESRGYPDRHTAYPGNDPISSWQRAEYDDRTRPSGTAPAGVPTAPNMDSAYAEWKRQRLAEEQRRQAEAARIASGGATNPNSGGGNVFERIGRTVNQAQDRAAQDYAASYRPPTEAQLQAEWQQTQRYNQIRAAQGKYAAAVKLADARNRADPRTFAYAPQQDYKVWRNEELPEWVRDFQEGQDTLQGDQAYLRAMQNQRNQVNALVDSSLNRGAAQSNTQTRQQIEQDARRRDNTVSAFGAMINQFESSGLPQTREGFEQWSRGFVQDPDLIAQGRQYYGDYGEREAAIDRNRVPKGDALQQFGTDLEAQGAMLSRYGFTPSQIRSIVRTGSVPRAPENYGMFGDLVNANQQLSERNAREYQQPGNGNANVPLYENPLYGLRNPMDVAGQRVIDQLNLQDYAQTEMPQWLRNMQVNAEQGFNGLVPGLLEGASLAPTLVGGNPWESLHGASALLRQPTDAANRIGFDPTSYLIRDEAAGVYRTPELQRGEIPQWLNYAAQDLAPGTLGQLAGDLPIYAVGGALPRAGVYAVRGAGQAYYQAKDQLQMNPNTALMTPDEQEERARLYAATGFISGLGEAVNLGKIENIFRNNSSRALVGAISEMLRSEAGEEVLQQVGDNAAQYFLLMSPQEQNEVGFLTALSRGVVEAGFGGALGGAVMGGGAFTGGRLRDTEPQLEQTVVEGGAMGFPDVPSIPEFGMPNVNPQTRPFGPQLPAEQGQVWTPTERSQIRGTPTADLSQYATLPTTTFAQSQFGLPDSQLTEVEADLLPAEGVDASVPTEQIPVGLWQQLENVAARQLGYLPPNTGMQPGGSDAWGSNNYTRFFDVYDPAGGKKKDSPLYQAIVNYVNTTGDPNPKVTADNLYSSLRRERATVQARARQIANTQIQNGTLSQLADVLRGYDAYTRASGYPQGIGRAPVQTQPAQPSASQSQPRVLPRQGSNVVQFPQGGRAPKRLPTHNSRNPLYPLQQMIDQYNALVKVAPRSQQRLQQVERLRTQIEARAQELGGQLDTVKARKKYPPLKISFAQRQQMAPTGTEGVTTPASVRSPASAPETQDAPTTQSTYWRDNTSPTNNGSYYTDAIEQLERTDNQSRNTFWNADDARSSIIHHLTTSDTISKEFRNAVMDYAQQFGNTANEVARIPEAVREIARMADEAGIPPVVINGEWGPKLSTQSNDSNSDATEQDKEVDAVYSALADERAKWSDAWRTAETDEQRETAYSNYKEASRKLSEYVAGIEKAQDESLKNHFSAPSVTDSLDDIEDASPAETQNQAEIAQVQANIADILKQIKDLTVKIANTPESGGVGSASEAIPLIAKLVGEYAKLGVMHFRQFASEIRNALGDTLSEEDLREAWRQGGGAEEGSFRPEVGTQLWYITPRQKRVRLTVQGIDEKGNIQAYRMDDAGKNRIGEGTYTVRPENFSQFVYAHPGENAPRYVPPDIRPSINEDAFNVNYQNLLDIALGNREARSAVIRDGKDGTPKPGTEKVQASARDVLIYIPRNDTVDTAFVLTQNGELRATNSTWRVEMGEDGKMDKSVKQKAGSELLLAANPNTGRLSNANYRVLQAIAEGNFTAIDRATGELLVPPKTGPLLKRAPNAVTYDPQVVNGEQRRQKRMENLARQINNRSFGSEELQRLLPLIQGNSVESQFRSAIHQTSGYFSNVEVTQVDGEYFVSGTLHFGSTGEIARASTGFPVEVPLEAILSTKAGRDAMRQYDVNKVKDVATIRNGMREHIINSPSYAALKETGMNQARLDKWVETTIDTYLDQAVKRGENSTKRIIQQGEQRNQITAQEVGALREELAKGVTEQYTPAVDIKMPDGKSFIMYPDNGRWVGFYRRGTNRQAQTYDFNQATQILRGAEKITKVVWTTNDKVERTNKKGKNFDAPTLDTILSRLGGTATETPFGQGSPSAAERGEVSVEAALAPIREVVRLGKQAAPLARDIAVKTKQGLDYFKKNYVQEGRIRVPLNASVKPVPDGVANIQNWAAEQKRAWTAFTSPIDAPPPPKDPKDSRFYFVRKGIRKGSELASVPFHLAGKGLNLTGKTAFYGGIAALGYALVNDDDDEILGIDDDGNITGLLADAVNRAVQRAPTTIQKFQSSFVPTLLDSISQPTMWGEQMFGLATTIAMGRDEGKTVANSLGWSDEEYTYWQEFADADKDDWEKRAWWEVQRIFYSGPTAMADAYQEIADNPDLTQEEIDAILEKHSDWKREFIGRLALDPLEVANSGILFANAVPSLRKAIWGADVPINTISDFYAFRRAQQMMGEVNKSVLGGDQSALWRLLNRKFGRTSESNVMRGLIDSLIQIESRVGGINSIDDAKNVLVDFLQGNIAGRGLEELATPMNQRSIDRIIKNMVVRQQVGAGDEVIDDIIIPLNNPNSIEEMRRTVTTIVLDHMQGLLTEKYLPSSKFEQGVDFVNRLQKGVLSNTLMRTPQFFVGNVANNNVLSAMDGWWSLRSPGASRDWFKGTVGYVPSLLDEAFDITGRSVSHSEYIAAATKNTDKPLIGSFLNAEQNAATQVYTAAYQHWFPPLWQRAVNGWSKGLIREGVELPTGFLQELQGTWGDAQIMATFRRWESKLPSGVNIDDVRDMAGRVRAGAMGAAEEMRGFTLLNYWDKSKLDRYGELLFPFMYWGTRNVGNWVRRIADNPEFLSRYQRVEEAIKSAMWEDDSSPYLEPDYIQAEGIGVTKAQLNRFGTAVADGIREAMNSLVGWQIDEDDLPKNLWGDFLVGSMDDGERIYVNLLSRGLALDSVFAFAPGTAYVPYVDEEEATYFTTMMNMANKFPAGLNPFFGMTMAIADNYFNDRLLTEGQNESNIPFAWNRPIRAASQLASDRGVPGIPSGGYDMNAGWRTALNYEEERASYEEDRIVARLADQVRLGEITKEQADEAISFREGEVYDQALEWTTRYYGDRGLMSFFTGFYPSADPHTELRAEQDEYFRIRDEEGEEAAKAYMEEHPEVSIYMMRDRNWENRRGSAATSYFYDSSSYLRKVVETDYPELAPLMDKLYDKRATPQEAIMIAEGIRDAIKNDPDEAKRDAFEEYLNSELDRLYNYSELDSQYSELETNEERSQFFDDNPTFDEARDVRREAYDQSGLYPRYDEVYPQQEYPPSTSLLERAIDYGIQPGGLTREQINDLMESRDVGAAEILGVEYDYITYLKEKKYNGGLTEEEQRILSDFYNIAYNNLSEYDYNKLVRERDSYSNSGGTGGGSGNGGGSYSTYVDGLYASATQLGIDPTEADRIIQAKLNKQYLQGTDWDTWNAIKDLYYDTKDGRTPTTQSVPTGVDSGDWMNLQNLIQ